MRKTLSVRPPEERADAPKLQKKGRGWNITESRLDTLHETAREMRRSPTEAQTLLGDALARAELGKFRFKPQVVIGSAIVDFACQPLKVAVEIDEPDANAEIERRRDRSLADVGIKLLRYSAEQVREDADAVVQAIVAEMKLSYQAQRARPAAHNRRPPAGARGYQR
jgi:very-short-patch-repair endonuclease